MRFVRKETIELELLKEIPEIKALFAIRNDQRMIGIMAAILPHTPAIIVTRGRGIVDGYARVEAAKQQGETELACQVFEYDDAADMVDHALRLNPYRPRTIHSLQRKSQG